LADYIGFPSLGGYASFGKSHVDGRQKKISLDQKNHEFITFDFNTGSPFLYILQEPVDRNAGLGKPGWTGSSVG
jgi:hypothetical protein